jgi:hypothetical protein
MYHSGLLLLVVAACANRKHYLQYGNRKELMLQGVESFLAFDMFLIFAIGIASS